MIELKRCPFCGDEVEIVPTGLYHWKYAIRHKSKTECILDANAFALPYEEEDAVRMWNTRADRKTESNSEKPNNCEDWHGDCKTCEWYDGTSCGIPCCDYEPKDEPTSSKMEQVDEPKTQMKTQNSNLTFEKADEPQTDNGIGCSRCGGRFDCYDRDMPHAVHCNNYGKITDEPQTEQVGVPFGEMDDETFKTHCLNCQRDTADIKCLDCDGNKYFLPYGSQTDCAWRRDDDVETD